MAETWFRGEVGIPRAGFIYSRFRAIYFYLLLFFTLLHAYTMYYNHIKSQQIALKHEYKNSARGIPTLPRNRVPATRQME